MPRRISRLAPITFTANGTYSWQNECNGNSGEFTVDHGTFEVTEIGSLTAVSCRGPEHDNLLQRAVSVETDGETLSFFGPGGDELVRYRPA